jgi:glutamate synthase domain-containing protein 2
VYSPTFHTAFNSPRGLLEFVEKLRGLSGGKPVGFKLCIGRPEEFFSLAKAMLESGIYPDFITVDGGEGGTGAAPPEFSNSVGMPFMDALAFVHDSLNGFGIRDKTRIIASGKILTGFHIVRAMALGADTCNSARAMMLALGCIQALLCNTNRCPTGVTTQDKWKMAGLVVEDKKQRVANYQQDTVESSVELIAAAGMTDPTQVERSMIYRRVFMNAVKSFAEIYPDVEPGSYLNGAAPEAIRRRLERAKVDTWH